MYCSARVRDIGLLRRRGLVVGVVLVGVVLLEVHGEELDRVFRPFLHLTMLRRVSCRGSRTGDSRGLTNAAMPWLSSETTVLSRYCRIPIDARLSLALTYEAPRPVSVGLFGGDTTESHGPLKGPLLRPEGPCEGPTRAPAPLHPPG